MRPIRIDYHVAFRARHSPQPYGAMPEPHDGTLTPGQVAALLQDARERTLLLVASVPVD